SENVITGYGRTTLGELIVDHIHILANQKAVFKTTLYFMYLLNNGTGVRDRDIGFCAQRRRRLVFNEAFDIGRSNEAGAHAVVKVEMCRRFEVIAHLFEHGLAWLLLQLPYFPENDLLSIFRYLLLVFLQFIFNARFSLRGDDESQPVFMRLLLLGSQDFDLVAVLKDVIDRHQLVVDFCSNTLRTDLRVYFESKVKRRRSIGQVPEFTFRSEDKNLIAEQVTAEVVNKVEGRVIVLFQQVAHPCQPLLQ